MDEKKIIRQISTVGIAGNVALVAFKMYAGIAGHSPAMVSDAVHSLSDVFATLIAFIGVRLSLKAGGRTASVRARPHGMRGFAASGLHLLATAWASA